jgi:hypothetical protein
MIMRHRAGRKAAMLKPLAGKEILGALNSARL